MKQPKRTNPESRPVLMRPGLRLAYAAVAAALLLTAPRANAVTVAVSPTSTATYVGDAVTLSASLTNIVVNSKNGNGANYTWSASPVLPAPVSVTFSAATGQTPKNQTAATVTTTFKVTGITAMTDFTVELSVTDASNGGAVKTYSTVRVYPAPVANAGSDRGVAERTPVTLNGSGLGTAGGFLSYQWTAPAGITLSNPTAASPIFTAPEVPRESKAFTFTLVVTETRAGFLPKVSAPDQVTINVTEDNRVPTASISGDSDAAPAGGTNVIEINADENTLVTLTGTGVDADGDTLTLSWTQVRDTAGNPLQPGDTVVQLLDASSTTPSFTAPNVTPAQGAIDLYFMLTVSDGLTTSGPSYIMVHVVNTNDPPKAIAAVLVNGTPTEPNASGNYSVTHGDVVKLLSTSTDPDNDELAVTWTLLDGTPQESEFTAQAPLHQSTTLTYKLTVADAEVSDSTAISINVIYKNTAPTADAGADDKSFAARSLATLDGSASGDFDGDDITYSWTQIGGPSVDLNDITAIKPTFTAPTVGPLGAVLTFQLTVADNYGGTAFDTVQVTVTYLNRIPTAIAGAAQTVNEGTSVSLSGSGTDPDANLLTYSWSQLSGPDVTPNVDTADASKATFTAPSVTNANGVVVMRLTVDDGYGGIATSDVVINVGNVNNPPTADAGTSQNVKEGDAVSLNGTGSDADTEEVASLNYTWAQVGGPSVSLSGSGKNLSFSAPAIPNAKGDPTASVKLTFKLTVTDINGAPAADEMDVTVVNVPHAPTAVAGGPASVNENGEVTLNGLASKDPDYDELTYSWTLMSAPQGSNIQIQGANTATPTFIAPFVSTGASATVEVELTVNDGYGGISSDTVAVTVLNSNTPPALPTIAANLRASEQLLWSPDHRMVPVQILGVIDPNENHTITITGVTQDEATNGLGDGDTAVDAVLQGSTAQIRAERSGKGDGRVYRVNFTASDFEGSVNGSVLVKVPKGKKTDPVIDSLPNVASRIDSTK